MFWRAGFPAAICSWSRAPRAPARPRWRCNSCSKARKARRDSASTSRCRKPSDELREGAASHGWALDDGIEVFELVPPESLLDAEQQQSLLYSSDLELGETTKQIFEAVERASSRAAWCSTACPRSGCWRRARCATAARSWRSNIISRKLNATVLLLDDLTAELADKTVHSVAHGVMRLEELAPDYGAERRRAARHQISRRRVSRRLSRLHHHDRRRATCFRGWWRRNIARSFVRDSAVERHRRAR